MGLIRRPFVFTVVAVALWLLVQQLGGLDKPELIKQDETIMTSGFITALSLFIALLASGVFLKVWSEWIEVRNAIRSTKQDEEIFMRYADERLPSTVKAAIIILFVFLLGAFFILHIASVVTGIYITFGITFALTFYWEVIMDFDDYWTGEWNIDIRMVPDDWEWAKKNKARILSRLK